jgi:hypothetical protein
LPGGRARGPRVGWAGAVVRRALPATQSRFDGLLRALAEPEDHSYVLAELNDFLSALSGPELAEAVGLAEPAVFEALPDYERNHVAASNWARQRGTSTRTA